MIHTCHCLVELLEMIGQSALGINVQGSAELFRKRLDSDLFAEQLAVYITELMHEERWRMDRASSNSVLECKVTVRRVDLFFQRGKSECRMPKSEGNANTEAPKRPRPVAAAKKCTANFRVFGTFAFFNALRLV